MDADQRLELIRLLAEDKAWQSARSPRFLLPSRHLRLRVTAGPSMWLRCVGHLSGSRKGA